VPDLWTWGGKHVGHRDGREFWSPDGRHAGRFVEDELYAPDGYYLGEVLEGRLIYDRSKESKRAVGFAAEPLRHATGQQPDEAPLPVPEGYKDFPRLWHHL
jgi:hypothetical protein